ncbi:leucine-rich repeat-containing protein 15-like [Harmonia axyridis]|uniref:leucine-rich repeat-containing protein 15-like n=1 Tax=Harmonia axyridis TaxID=115357 RepID=UPI001E275464|nr:leucine-rich repeat-containing protein 15-like [Harmonia axyridis]
MWVYVLFGCLFVPQNVVALWGANTGCPSICTCKLEHLTETPIHRFMQTHKNRPKQGEILSVELNDVIPEDSLDSDIFQEKTIVRSATCILQTETVPAQLIKNLPDDIETLTLIQGYESGNKTIKLGDLLQFKQLVSLELLGPQLFQHGNSHLFCEIDKPLPDLKYFSLERILIQNSKKQLQNFVKEVNEEEMTFEYTQKFDSNAHPLTLIQEGTNEEILPYSKYKTRKEYARVPLFFGFKNLNLLRIKSCELNVVHWEMFEGLQNLEYLILEENNLHFIPPFAFYGTPNLKTLSLSHNSLLDIQITDLAGLLELSYLDLSFNNFSQLSELSLPPFPNLKLANFANNPITVIFPNTFEVMNTTDSLIIGSDDMELSLLKNSFLGLEVLKILELKNLHVKLFKRELLSGMPNLKELVLTGNITELEFDSFLEVYQLNKLILSNCQIQNISMDTFVGLEELEYLDLSNNKLEYLPPNVFDELTSLKELYLNDNKLVELPRDVFARIHPKLLRLNKNPWHCSCQMSEWKPMIVNKLKRKTMKHCDRSMDKGIGCVTDNQIYFKYVYDNKIAPKCATPLQYANWSVFQVMRRLLKCPAYKPKLRKNLKIPNTVTTFTNNSTEILKLEPTETYDKSLMEANQTKLNQTENSGDNQIVSHITSAESVTSNSSEEILNNKINIHNNGTHPNTHKRRRVYKMRKYRKFLQKKFMAKSNIIQ